MRNRVGGVWVERNVEEEKERSKGDHKILWFQWRSIGRKKKIEKDVECGERGRFEGRNKRERR